MVILSGNKQDRYAGVGAIVAPRLRPHLLDVIQVSSRIIHLAFKMQGGNLHTVGAYAPHSGLDLETIREPFWEQLQDHVSNIPQPEPVVVTGDFNVRFQAKHRNDGHCLGPFVYGKGPSFIDHSASSNRTLCRSFLQHQNMVEAASYKTPDLLKHITYRDKAAPPSDWSQFVLDPIPLQQIYTKLEARLGELALDVSSKAQADGVLPNRRRDGDFAIILERPTPTTKGTSALTHWLTEGKHRLDFFRPGATERSEGGDRSKASEVGNHTSLLQESRSDEFAAQLKLRPHLFDPSPDLGPFKLEELQQALSQTAKGKAPGPDGIEADLFKLLDHTSEIALLDLYNQARHSGSGPETCDGLLYPEARHARNRTSRSLYEMGSKLSLMQFSVEGSC
ncbi:unnamed protein product [Symbiodinium sp. KB8]|nr:unnamed protein product [Symbiodinium sp. KB8]